jgi:HNH endonuclease
MPELSQRQINRFWKKVDRTGSCWIWTASRDVAGYGQVQIQKQHYRAHRIAYELTYGPIPEGLVLLHLCDTRSCCRPDHLRAGTQADNVRDAMRKGRHRTPKEQRAFGEDNSQAALTWEQVREIRAKYATGRYKKRALAREYGVSWFTMWDILAGNRWKED